MRNAKDPFYVTWFYRSLLLAASSILLILIGHFLNLVFVLNAGVSIFVLSWLGAVAMIPFGALAQLKKWFGDETS